MIEKVGDARPTLARSSRRRKWRTASVIGTVQDQSRVGPSGDPARHLPISIMIFHKLMGYKFPSLAKEGWRVAPGWFEAAIPQIR